MGADHGHRLLSADWLLSKDQRTKLIAIAGVIEACVLWAAGMTRVPTSTPRLDFQLYSIAGAKAKTSLDPEFSWMLDGFCVPLESGMSYPVAWVLALWRYVASSASTHFRVRLYSPDAST